MNLAIMVSTDNRTILWASAGLLEHAGCAPDDLVGRRIADVVDGASEELAAALFAPDRRSRPCHDVPLTIASRDGARRYTLRHVRFIDGGDETVAYVGLRAGHRPECPSDPAQSEDAVITTDAEARINGWNTSAALLYGWLFEEVRGRRIGEVLGASDPRIELQMDAEAGTDHVRVWTGPVRHRHRDGRVVVVESECTVIRDEDGRAEGLLVIGRPSRDRMTHQHDELTGLVGRSAVLTSLAAAPADELSMVLVVDIDHFGQLNARLGEAAGDAVLVAVADRLAGALRGDDFVARLGGDRFCVVAVIERGVEAEALAQRLERVLAEPIEIEGNLLSISASLGAAWGVNGKRAARLHERAEAALRTAQAAGGRRLCFHRPGNETGGWHDDDVFVADCRAALETGAIHVAYQPIVELGSGRLRKVEALARWTHPDRGPIPPAQFIPPAERSGVIDELGEWILGRACNDVAVMRAAGLDVSLSVNVSAVQLRDPDLSHRVERVLERTCFPADQLWIEVTESVLVDDEALPPLAELHDLGVHLVIDDFGTGYATLQYLSRLPVDALKIDMSFVWGLGVEMSDTAIVRSVVNLGRELGLQVVAEGVETESQRTQLIALNCRLAQGWLFGRAVSLEELLAEFTDRSAEAPGCRTTQDDQLALALANESMRIAALEACRILDTSAEHAFDSLVRLAARLLDTPMAVFCLVDADREWFKARVGVEISEVPRTIAFCSHTMADPHGPFVVADATADARFADHPYVAGEPQIRAYAGMAVLSREELALGSFCVLDTAPRRFTDDQIEVLRSLAMQAGTLLHLRRRVAELNDQMHVRTRRSVAPELLPVR